MAAAADHAATAIAIPGDPLADSACSTPFVSAPSSPTREREREHHFASPHGAPCFFSAPASPTRGGGGGGCLGDFDFDFSSRFPSPSAAAMSSADELFHNGQIRAVRLSAMLLQPQPLAPLVDGDGHASHLAEEDAAAVEEDGAEADERGRIRSRSVRRKARSMSPFRTRWRAPSPAPETAEEVEAVATPAASRSSSSSSTASSASSTSSRGSRRWAFLKDLLHRSKSDGGKNHHHDTAPPPPPPKRSPSPSPSPSPAPAAASARGGRGAATGRRSRRRSAHERLYEARRAEAEEMRRRTYLPYRQGLLLFGCIGLGSRGYGAVHGLARGLNAAAAVSSRS
ncbi:uncharacterized protein [Oryza sativa Japonica Group]|jgi:hypothetical protein|uniref:Expressed protein n=3 Tax=Oryza sativa TaxID=4530 RepID=Q2QZT3_ORYSJ|nr:serine/arginine repetitive matrix protein 1 [Oryza sativa Japonica Group]EAZ01011.1 hypothetical protein OsI_23044 [Oryza sativa Indica Group]KAB8116096.1 hypothetical protein EE612_057061 [Oryza sativa]ABA95270.1 expressed protein [Oryza sativa Japonica Group]KAF2912071.1 hypothetical protein DAI22_11g228600 [Oryza sativa Japonica Group]BAF28800.1 Os11g0672900 [Oryza sativa Japonica Group]|eukprot:NP_001068437.1 Os11g0672900 [Oryza sativa Japonica Group]